MRLVFCIGAIIFAVFNGIGLFKENVARIVSVSCIESPARKSLVDRIRSLE